MFSFIHYFIQIFFYLLLSSFSTFSFNFLSNLFISFWFLLPFLISLFFISCTQCKWRIFSCIYLLSYECLRSDLACYLSMDLPFWLEHDQYLFMVPSFHWAQRGQYFLKNNRCCAVSNCTPVWQMELMNSIYSQCSDISLLIPECCYQSEPLN